jgi:hypothetical protein
MNDIAFDKSAGREKRWQNRLRLELTGTAVFDPEGRAAEGEVLSKNINGYGAYFLTRTRPEVDDLVAVDLHADSSQPKFSLKAIGRILRVDQLSKNAFGFAVTFDAVTHFSHH